MSIELFFNWQPIKGQIKFHLRDLQAPVEKIRQLCSRGVWRLDVPTEYTRLAPARLLRPGWMAFLTILRAVLMPSLIS